MPVTTAPTRPTVAPQQRVKIDLHVGQSLAWRAQDAKIIAMIAGTGGGKTYFGPRWLYREWQNEVVTGESTPSIVMSASYPMMTRVTLPEFRGFWDPLEVGTYRAADRVYSTTHKPVFFGSAERVLGMEGIHAGRAWLDEAGMMPREVLDVARRRTAFYKGPILITTTPYSQNWLKTEVYDNATVDRVTNLTFPPEPPEYQVERIQEGNEDYYVVQYASTINPNYPLEEFENAKRTWPQWKFNLFFLGQFDRPEGLVYQDFLPVEEPEGHLVEPFDIPRHWPRWAGQDTGFNHPTGIVWIAQNPDNGIMYLYRAYRDQKKDGRAIGREIAKLSVGQDGKYERLGKIWCDPSRPDVIADINNVCQEEGMPGTVKAVKADNDVDAGIMTGIKAFRGGQLRVFKSANSFRDEVETYRWQVDKETDDLVDTPVKKRDDVMDAFRYAMHRDGKTNRRNMGMFFV